MYIEKNCDTQLCTIWVESEKEAVYKKDAEYQATIKDCKANGMSVCVFVGGDMPIISVIDDALSMKNITA